MAQYSVVRCRGDKMFDFEKIIGEADGSSSALGTLRLRSTSGHILMRKLLTCCNKLAGILNYWCTTKIMDE